MQMRQLFLLLFFLFIKDNCLAQKNNFQCPCSKIGIDERWADSNKVQCFLIPVDKAYKQTSGGKYYLAAATAVSQNKSKELPLLYLHGGPGISTLGNLPSYLKSPTWKLMREKHDLVFFDYRGTGFSEPGLCTYLPDSLSAFARTNPAQNAIKEKEVSLYQRCKDSLLKQGIHLETFSSFQLAADVDAIRQALKIDKWNVYSVSYGTTVALNVIRSFPSGLTSVILDSPFPPNAPWVDFVRPFDTCFKVLEKRLTQDASTAEQFATLRSDFAAAVKRLNEKPVRLLPPEKNDSAYTYNYTGDDFAWSIWSAMLKPKAIPFVPLAIREVANGNDSVLQLWSTAFSSPDAHGKFSATQSNAILCFEGKPQNPEDSQDSLLKKYPELSSFNAGFNVPVCNVWRPDIPPKEIFDPVVSNVPVLILAGEYDPVCPPFFGELTAKTLSRSKFLLIPSASHAAIHADDCTRNIAYDFLSFPGKELPVQCIALRPKMVFLEKNLYSALKNYK
jgi:pimeloyl-ACP methyl ester carboxylesterase